jgi:hypothetical protein
MNLGGVLAAISRASASRSSSVLGFGFVSMKRGLVRPAIARARALGLVTFLINLNIAGEASYHGSLAFLPADLPKWLLLFAIQPTSRAKSQTSNAHRVPRKSVKNLFSFRRLLAEHLMRQPMRFVEGFSLQRRHGPVKSPNAGSCGRNPSCWA